MSAKGSKSAVKGGGGGGGGGGGAGGGAGASEKQRGSAPTFASLSKPALHASTLQVVTELGFRHMTPVQAATIPLFLNNKDVAVEVQKHTQ